MTSYKDIQKIRKFEEEATKLGFEICDATYWARSASTSFIVDEIHSSNMLGLRPLHNHYPTYTRGAVVFTGSMEEAERFLQGIQFAYDTDKAIRLSNEVKRGIAEAKEVDRIRRREEIKEQKKMWGILSDQNLSNHKGAF